MGENLRIDGQVLCQLAIQEASLSVYWADLPSVSKTSVIAEERGYAN